MGQFLELGIDTFGDITADVYGRTLSHAEVVRNVVEEAVLADQVGIDCFGVGEHHRADFAVSAPEVVLGVIAGRTTRIRLASATTVLSSDDPVRVFQRFSTLHAATNGRAEVMLGRGWFTESFSLFGYNVSEYDKLFEDKLDLFAALIRRDSVTWRGKTRPHLINQRVFPPIENKPLKTWIAVGSTPESALRAARYNLPMMLAVIGGEPERFKPFIELYRLAFERLGRPMQPIGVHSAGYVAETDEQAREEFWTDYKRLRDRIGVERGWPPIDQTKFEVEADRGALYVGSPESVARKIAKTAKTLQLSRFDLKYSVGALAHEKLMRSIELFGGEVVPMIRDMLA
jgi:probable LLM family oxidoreductase